MISTMSVWGIGTGCKGHLMLCVWCMLTRLLIAASSPLPWGKASVPRVGKQPNWVAVVWARHKTVCEECLWIANQLTWMWNYSIFPLQSRFLRAIVVSHADVAPLSIASTELHPHISSGGYQTRSERNDKTVMFLNCWLLQPGKFVGNFSPCLYLFGIVFPLHPVDTTFIGLSRHAACIA